MSDQEDSKPKADANKSSTPQNQGANVSAVPNQLLKKLDEKLKRLGQR
ncbi:MAG: hypothetical protein HWQ35_24800 [Nostoc sp. NMS1]|nr:hypothetical protein [Nostoc sp. NMS1]MBN3909634.1 hypothetical protein [Nostoc sp. NMS1]